MNQKPAQVLHVSRILQHYREGVLRKLDESEVTEFTFLADDFSGEEQIPTIPRDVFRNAHRIQNRWIGPLLWQKGLQSFLLRNRFDVAIFEGDVKHLSTWVGVIIARLRGAQTYFWTIGWHRPDKTFLKRTIRKTFYRLAHSVLLYGIDGYNIGKASGFPTDRMQIIGNSYPGEGAYLARHTEALDLSELSKSNGKRVVGAVVRLNFNKRLDLLIEAVQILRERGEDVSVLLTGSGPAEEHLRGKASDLGVPLVLTGAAFDEESINAVYEKLEITVLPERAGLTVMQSMARGKPVITADDPYRQVPEFRAVKNGKTGYLYPAGDVDALAEAISNCLHELDSEGREFAERCREEIDNNWTASSHAERILKALKAGRDEFGFD